MKQNEYPYRNPALPLEERVEDLLGRMTLEEKVDQLMQITIGADTNPNNAGDGHSFRPTIGSVLSYSGGAKNRNAFQRLAVEHTRLGIPIIWGYDVIHGWRTGFPIPLAQACSWDPSLIGGRLPGGGAGIIRRGGGLDVFADAGCAARSALGSGDGRIWRRPVGCGNFRGGGGARLSGRRSVAAGDDCRLFETFRRLCGD